MALLRSTLAVLMTAALLLPFCGCHALLLAGQTDSCCGRPAMALDLKALAARETTPRHSPDQAAAPIEAIGSCSAHCCGAKESAAPVSSDAIETTAEDESQDTPTAPCDPESKRVPQRGPECSQDTCCVKCAPLKAPWSHPALQRLADIFDAHAGVARDLLARGPDWPPTLPLGQPPAPLAQGTKLTV